ncbi:MAG: chromate efflux transporter [Lentimonas sp.]
MSSHRHRLFEIFWIYLRLGCLSFGGPVAHLAYFKGTFVTKRKWLTSAHFTELLGLCQFVPGPTSSQLGFAIGWHRGGLSGACAAWLGFTLPSAILMIAAAYGLFTLGASADALIRGLLIAAVAVVANAAIGLTKSLCPDIPRRLLVIASAAAALIVPTSWIQLAVVIAGLGIGSLCFDRPAQREHSQELLIAVKPWAVYGCLAGYSALLGLAILANNGGTNVSIYAAHYQAGALVFGGGHVVLPLLEQGLVPNIVSEANFLAGYSAAQALPGPLFTLSAFLGTASESTEPLLLGGIGALIAIFLPGLLLLVVLLPTWHRLRTRAWAQAGLIGANAAVLGLLFAALFDPVIPHAIHSISDGLVAAVALLALYRFKMPAWSTVLMCGAFGLLQFKG